MKVTNKVVRWEHEPWTVVRVEPDGHGDMWYAFNTRTGERKPVRYSYDVAYEDIPVSPYAEPWGV
jgi:hypothetical protein